MKNIAPPNLPQFPQINPAWIFRVILAFIALWAVICCYATVPPIPSAC